MRILPSGSTALLVELADLEEVLGLYAALADDVPTGVVDIVPAARTLLLVTREAIRNAVLHGSPNAVGVDLCFGPSAIRLDELGYTDLSDSFEEMKIRAKEKHFNFPYLYDGATQSTAKAYGPVATPHVFIFDKERKLRYQGRIDDKEKPTGTPQNLDTRNAIEALESPSYVRTGFCGLCGHVAPPPD